MKIKSIFPIKRKSKKIYHADFEYNGKIHRISLKVSTRDEALKKWNEIYDQWKKK